MPQINVMNACDVSQYINEFKIKCLLNNEYERDDVFQEADIDDKYEACISKLTLKYVQAQMHN